jgi:hypothetical protein
MSLFKMRMPDWFYKETAIWKALWSAREELDRAQNDEQRREAEKMIARHEFTLKRLEEEREYKDGLIRLLSK